MSTHGITGATRGALPVVVLAGLIAVASVAVTAVQGVDHLGVALCFVALITVGEVVRIVLPGDRETAPLAAAGSLAYALLATWPDGLVMDYGVAQVVTVVTVVTHKSPPRRTPQLSPRPVADRRCPSSSASG